MFLLEGTSQISLFCQINDNISIFQAVRNRLLPSQSDQVKVHLELSDYYQRQSENRYTVIEELPFHLSQAKSYQR